MLLIISGRIVMNTWIYAWEILINILESSFLLVFMEDKMEHTKRIPNGYASILKIAFVMADAMLTCVLNFYHVNYEICTLIGLFSFICFAVIFYDAKLSLKLLFSTTYLAIIFAAETIVASLPQFFLHSKITDLSVGGALRIPITFMYIACIAGFVFISHFIKWRRISMSPLETLLYILICVLGFFFGQYIVTVTHESFILFNIHQFSNKLVLVSTIYCILFLVLLTYLYVLNYTKEQNRNLMEEKQQLLLEEADYKNLIATTESLRKLKHDMQHHLATIQFLAQKNRYDEMNAYIDTYLGNLEDIHKFISSGNSAIDCITSTCILKAEQKGILVDSAITVPDTFDLDPILTSSLLGNLWTNAITACETLVNSNKDAFIDFYIKPVENMLLISIENSFDGICKKDSQDNYISIKHSKSNGIGLKRVNEIVEQNDGIIDITNTDTLFCVHIMFPLKEKDIYENCNT